MTKTNNLVSASPVHHLVGHFTLWCFAMAIAFVAMFAWILPSACIIMVWGSYRRWTPHDHQYWMMPFAPIMYIDSLFDSPNKAKGESVPNRAIDGRLTDPVSAAGARTNHAST